MSEKLPRQRKDDLVMNLWLDHYLSRYVALMSIETYHIVIHLCDRT